MKVIFQKSELIKALAPAMGSVSTKNTITAIEGIMINTDKEKCILYSYDLEKGVRIEVPAVISEEGSYIINANKLNQIIRLMPEGNITIEVDSKNIAKIYSGKAEFELHALPGSDFPNLPELSGDMGFSIKFEELKKMITKTSFAIAQNDHRPALNGAFFIIKDDRIKVVTCDGNRLAIRENTVEIENKFGEDKLDISFIIPGKTLNELIRIAPDEEEKITLLLTRKHIVFVMGDFIFFSRLIDNEYIDYQRFIPKSNKTFVTIDPEQFITCLERASLVTEDRTMGQTKSPVKCSYEGDLLKISSVSVSGRVYDEIQIEKEGEDLTIGYNCRYLLDALRGCDTDKIKISMSGPLMSTVLEPVDDSASERFLLLVLPVKMKE